MKSLTEFLKTTILGGLFVLLPLGLFYLLIGEILGIMVAIATPIADLFPAGTFDDTRATGLIALVLIVGVSFLLGLLMKLTIGRRVGNLVEQRILMPIPGYRAIKSLTQSLADAPEAEGFKPILLSSNGQRELGYLIEELGNGYSTVLLPWAPTPLAGTVKIVPTRQIQRLEASLADMTAVLTYWGIGTKRLLDQETEPGALTGP